MENNTGMSDKSMAVIEVMIVFVVCGVSVCAMACLASVAFRVVRWGFGI